ncbi:MAG: adenine-specific methyltransferase EcoRI family protein [Evtepia sp.]|uniref:adenine-specific methyltransferase EcoRI family protein n=1 Tax=Evtepia sp. TaxID=2773933 RepID=UPI002A753F56|nr:adenine-specific methyltransferase EcoRI family protein [Evtepia sp.]MDY3013757.1 adenine-specific methyltransferase EcoRI family protein [Evtepia sp.]
MANTALGAAKTAKNDEFYTQLTDIEKEMRHYRKHFQGKTVLCNCDDPFESNFFKYFVLNFNRLGLKKLIATCYYSSPIAGRQLKYSFDPDGQLTFVFETKTDEENKDQRPYKAVVTRVYDATGDGSVDMLDVAELFRSGENELVELEDDGDFRSPECLNLLDEADIVVTNPPFSLFRDYISVLMEHQKYFIIIGNMNAITYKEFFPLLKDNKVWIGAKSLNQDMYFDIPDERKQWLLANKKEGSAYKIINGVVMGRLASACWFTNLDIKKRHEEMILVKRYNPEEYPTYDNYDAIEVSKTADIPCDFSGVMGVPITFLDKYNPDQFEIVGIAKTWFGAASKVYGQQIQVDKNGKQSVVTKLNDGPVLKVSTPPVGKTYYIVDNEFYVQGYARILIRNKHPEPPKEVK